MNTLPILLPAPRPHAAPPPAQSRTHYAFAVPTDARVALARGWLHLGLAALIGSGLFSILLVVSRTPGLNRLLPVADFFHVALVVHVDLSVLVWFVALAGMLWSLNASPRHLRWGQAALALAALGAVAMAREILPGNRNLPCPDGHKAGNRAQQGRFSGAIRADDADDLTGSDVEINAPQHLHLAVTGFEATYLQKRSGHAGAPRLAST